LVLVAVIGQTYEPIIVLPIFPFRIIGVAQAGEIVFIHFVGFQGIVDPGAKVIYPDGARLSI
jgi:hypothetical protein